jgi:hypothetical protein
MDGEMTERKVEGVGEEEVKERRRKEIQDKQCRMKDKLDWTCWLTSCLKMNIFLPQKANRREVRR